MASKGIAAGSLIWAILLVMAAQQPIPGAEASVAMERLYKDLFTDYNHLILPVAANQSKVTITLGLKLHQVLELNLQKQFLSTEVWVEQTWYDPRLQWDAQAYGDIDMIDVSAENIWTPNIVLLNNTDGRNYELNIVNMGIVFSNGTIFWKQLKTFKSTCDSDVGYFPFEIQTCFLRFGSLTYGGDKVEIKHVESTTNKGKVEVCIDSSQSVKNVEWEIIDASDHCNENYNEGLRKPFSDIAFKIVIRRELFFYLVNLILSVAPLISMAVLVASLPLDSNANVARSILFLAIMIDLFLLMHEVISPTSLGVSSFQKCPLVTLALIPPLICLTFSSLNKYHRLPAEETLPHLNGCRPTTRSQLEVAQDRQDVQ